MIDFLPSLKRRGWGFDFGVRQFYPKYGGLSRRRHRAIYTASDLQEIRRRSRDLTHKTVF